MELTQKQWMVGGFFLLAVVILTYSYYRSSGGASLPNKFRFLCVETGKFYALSRDEIKAIPSPNPSTGRKTLFPCSEDTDGRWYLESRYRNILENHETYKEAEQYINLETLELKIKP